MLLSHWRLHAHTCTDTIYTITHCQNCLPHKGKLTFKLTYILFKVKCQRQCQKVKSKQCRKTEDPDIVIWPASQDFIQVHTTEHYKNIHSRTKVVVFLVTVVLSCPRETWYAEWKDCSISIANHLCLINCLVEMCFEMHCSSELVRKN